MNTTNFEAMGKEDLRNACRAANISYSKLNNDGMRAALRQAAEKAVGSEKQEEVLETETGSDTQEEDKPLNTGNGLLGTLVQQAMGASEKKVTSSSPASSSKRSANSGLKIQKDREERNGIKRPSKGGLCAAVWDYCDEQSSIGITVTAKIVKEYGASQGWNLNNASIEFYNWRKFNGITSK